MDFSLSGPDKLKITLTPEDLAALNISYERLDYKDAHTREILIGLLSQGSAAAGFLPQKSKLYIEIYPRGAGGCVIYYTRLTSGERLSQSKFIPGPCPAAFAFEDTGILLRACAQTHHLYRHRIFKSSLYALGNTYRLIVCPLDYNDKLSVSFLSEYGAPVGEGAVVAAYIEERGELICADFALGTLAKIEATAAD